MSTTPEADTPQGAPSLEERIAQAEAPATPPQEEPQAPAATPTAQADEESSAEPNSLTNEEQSSDLSEEEALANAKNPERTRAYIERLKREKEEALAQATQRQQTQSVFDELRIPSAEQFAGLNQQQVDSVANQIVAEDGTVDIARLNAALEQANQQALFAQQQAKQAIDQVQRHEESRQLKEAYETYPQLDPKHKKFDENLYNLVSQTLMVENYAKGGAMTVKQAADHISQFYRKPETNLEKVKDEAVQEYKAAQAKRQQGPVESGKGEPRVALQDHEDLRARTRRGDASAVARRLEALDI